MKNHTLRSTSFEETVKIGKEFSENINHGSVIFLDGVLGAGKTAFTKGIALGLGINRMVNSPTFTIMKEYEGRLNLVHIDAYRLEGSNTDSLGIFDLIDDDSLIVIEWPKYIEDLGIDYDFHIKFSIEEDDTRTIEVKEC